MPSLRNLAPFLPLPLVFLVTTALLAGAVGPFYLACRYDPEYAYLLNGLNLVLGWAPEHVDHPGTPLQVVWAMVIRLSQPGSSDPALVMHVLTGAEGYLQGFRSVFLLACGVTLLWLGVTTARLTGSRELAWLAQATPFLLGENFLLPLRVNPEPFLLLLGLALIPLCLRLTLSERPPDWRRLVGLGLLGSTGLCLKITFAPVWLATFLLVRGWRAKSRLAALTVLGCLLWTLPIMTQYPRFLGWVWGLAAHEGEYGLGPAGLVRPETYLAGLATLLGQNPIFAVTALAGLAIWVLSRNGRTGQGGATSPWRRLLGAAVVAQLAQLLICAKHPQSRYLAPAAAFLALIWIALAQMLRVTRPEAIPRVRRWLPLAAALVSLVTLAGYGLLGWRLRSGAQQRLALSEFTARQSAGARIYYYGASSPVYALVFGSAFAGLHYSSAIEATLGPTPCRTWFLDNRRGLLYSLRGPIDPRELNAVRGLILLQGDYLSEPERRKLPVTGTLTVLRRYEDETIYELRPQPGP